MSKPFRRVAAPKQKEAAPLLNVRRAAGGRRRPRGSSRREAPRREHAGRMCYELALLTAVSAELAALAA